MFRAADVDDQVFVADGLADDLTGVDFLPGTDEKSAALLQMLQGIGAGGAVLVRDERAVLLHVDLPGHRLVIVEEGVEGSRAARGIQVGLAKPENTAGGNQKFGVDYPVIAVADVLQPPPPFAEYFADWSQILGKHLDKDPLDGFEDTSRTRGER